MKIYVVTIVVSVAAHWALVGGLSRAAHNAPKPQRVLEVAVVTPPPPPVIAEPEPPKPVEEKAKRPPPPKDMKVPEVKPKEPPPPNQDAAPPDEPAKPVFGISMSSTVSGNSGFQVRVGNTTMKDPDKDRTDPKDVKPYAGGAPSIVPVYSLAQMPKRLGECREPYPKEAVAAGVKGTIKLEVTIEEDGRVSEARPLSDLGYGTAASAVRAMMKCKFSPGSDGTKKVRTMITYSYVFNNEEE